MVRKKQTARKARKATPTAALQAFTFACDELSDPPPPTALSLSHISPYLSNTNAHSLLFVSMLTKHGSNERSV